jgi:uncharacterized HhH-GPD family protein
VVSGRCDRRLCASCAGHAAATHDEQLRAGRTTSAGLGRRGRYDRRIPDRLHFTDSDEANALIAKDPMALLIGLALDQQVTVQQAFLGPLRLRDRVGALDANTLAAVNLEPVFREKPAIHRYPAKMAERIHDLAVHLQEHYDGHAARVWTDAPDSKALRSNIEALPGFGEMKVKTLAALLAKRFGVAAAKDLVPRHPTLGDVDSPEALADYQAKKREHKLALKSSTPRPAPSKSH